eukprot:gene6085-2136_t
MPPAAASDLFWDKQVEAFGAVATEMGMSNITFVIHDFGSILGYMFAYKYPGLLRKVVSIDIGNTPTPGGQPPRGPECDG